MGFPTNGPLVLGTKNFKFFLFVCVLFFKTYLTDTSSTVLFLLYRFHHLH